MISCTGNGLNILIASTPSMENEWMSFACWFSVHRLLPEADISIYTPKICDESRAYFRWTSRAKIKQYRHNPIKELTKPLLVLPSNVVAVRKLPELPTTSGVSKDKSVYFLNTTDSCETIIENLCCPCLSDEIAAFTQIKEKCGPYDKNIWKGAAPFVKHPRRSELTYNEHAVLSLWEKMINAYTLMG